MTKPQICNWLWFKGIKVMRFCRFPYSHWEIEEFFITLLGVIFYIVLAPLLILGYGTSYVMTWVAWHLHIKEECKASLSGRDKRIDELEDLMGPPGSF